MNSPDRQPKCANAFSAQLRKSERAFARLADNAYQVNHRLHPLQPVDQRSRVQNIAGVNLGLEFGGERPHRSRLGVAGENANRVPGPR